MRQRMFVVLVVLLPAGAGGQRRCAARHLDGLPRDCALLLADQA